MKFFTLTLAVGLICICTDGLSEVLNRIDSPTTGKVVFEKVRSPNEDHANVAADKTTIAATRKLRKRENCNSGCMRCREGLDGFETCNRGIWLHRPCSPGTTCTTIGTCRVNC
uniref:Uncharacterized protein n=1 Tax=Romanomermis culicivorax TaxID=13658 RepID=A0A915L742_ROMCU